MKQNLVPVKDLVEELFYVEIIFVKENVIELKIHRMIFKGWIDFSPIIEKNAPYFREKLFQS